MWRPNENTLISALPSLPRSPSPPLYDVTTYLNRGYQIICRISRRFWRLTAILYWAFYTSHISKTKCCASTECSAWYLVHDDHDHDMSCLNSPYDRSRSLTSMYIYMASFALLSTSNCESSYNLQREIITTKCKNRSFSWITYMNNKIFQVLG